MGIASVFVGITVLMMVVGLAVNPFFLFVALPFGGSAYLMWYQASGKLAERMRRQAAAGQFNAAGRQRRAPGGFGPRASRAGFSARERARRARQNRRRAKRGTKTVSSRLSAAEARSILGVESSASQSEIKTAYRQQAKQHHPDTDGGNEARFKKISKAYETLSE